MKPCSYEDVISDYLKEKCETDADFSMAFNGDHDTCTGKKTAKGAYNYLIDKVTKQNKTKERCMMYEDADVFKCVCDYFFDAKADFEGDKKPSAVKVEAAHVQEPPKKVSKPKEKKVSNQLEFDLFSMFEDEEGGGDNAVVEEIAAVE